MFKILGYRKDEGTYTPPEKPNDHYAYSNYLFSFCTDENKNFHGLATAKDGMSIIKIREKDFKDLTGLDKPEDLVGKKCNLYYGLSYGKAVLQRVEIIPDK